MTDEEYQEIKKNFSNREWRLNNLYYIIDKKGHKVKFRCNFVQSLLTMNLWFLNLILKSRQHGITTLICILFLDLCLFNSNIQAGIIAHKLTDASNFFEKKIKFAYENLPQQLQDEVTLLKDTSMQLQLSNGSAIVVGTSLRSGTFQYLHISEFGKICAKYPAKAQEIVTGALNTVEVGQYVFIESTAEGRSGYFYDYCQEAEKRQQSGIAPNKMEFKLFFFGWYQDPTNRMDPQGVLISQELVDYFAMLEAKHGIVLDTSQKAWYAAKRKQQGEGMFQEHPSIPEEAFYASIQGAYYQKQMLFLRTQRPCRIGFVPHEPSIPVNTSWDLGMDDCTSIVFHQRYGMENRIIDFYEMNGESLHHYVEVLQNKGYVYGDHYLPHDSTVRSLTDKNRVTREEKLYELGLRNLYTVSRTSDIEDGIEEVRKFLLSCWLDQHKCERLIAALDEYRKEWDENLGVFRSHPLHNWASNPADAFRTLACGYVYRTVTQGHSGRSSRPRGSMAA